jgi:hypothetical protein
LDTRGFVLAELAIGQFVEGGDLIREQDLAQDASAV